MTCVTLTQAKHAFLAGLLLGSAVTLLITVAITQLRKLRGRP